jgi:hypothetical protein
MTRRGVIGLLVGVASAVLAGCGLVKSYPPFRYRLTIEVDTPQGLRTGSSVIEVSAGEVGTTLGGAGVEVRGEAAAVDLPGGQTLFALLRSDAGFDWAGGVMFFVTPVPANVSADEEIGRHVEAVHNNRKLNVLPRMKPGAYNVDPPVSAYPMMVRFRDSADPVSVEKVNPDNLASSFGAGVKLRRITVQVTDDAVTRLIDDKIGRDFWKRWGQIHQSELAKGKITDNEYFSSLAGRLSRNDFSTDSVK